MRLKAPYIQLYLTTVGRRYANIGCPGYIKSYVSTSMGFTFGLEENMIIELITPFSKINHQREKCFV
jgi:hypothetical protein